MIAPHFPPIFVILSYIGPFTVGWFHQWGLMAIFVPVAIAGEFLFTFNGRSFRQGSRNG
jgi:hypothetical protein